MISLISVVIPTYNQGDFIRDAVQSVIDQTYSNWEIIVIDNHSDDNTDEVLRSFKDVRIRLLKIHNKGVIAASRNMGINASCGEWIAFLDSDDSWTPDKLSICIDQISDDVDLIFHDLSIIGYKALRFQNKIRGKSLTIPVIADLLVNGNKIPNSSVIVRKSIIEKVGLLSQSKEMIAAEDYNLWLRIAEVTNNFCYIPRSLGFYRYHEDGGSRKNMSLAILKASELFIKYLDDRSVDKYMSRINYTDGRYQYLNGNYNDSLNILSKVFKRGRMDIRIKSFWMVCISLVLVMYKKLSQIFNSVIK